MRYDRRGGGNPTSGGAATYNAAFPNRDTRSGSRMGCPSGTCGGYELVADLDFDSDGDGDVDANDHGGAYWDSGAGWTPIGGVGSTAAWRTTFRGNGHTINNLFINRPGVANQALFVHLWSEGRIESLGVTNADITGGNRTAILVRNNNGNIIGCYVTGKVTGGDYVGGLVAYLERIIRSSYSHASVTGASRVGGLVGHVQHAGPRIYNSYSTGRVTGTSNVGGLVGYLHGSATLNNTVNSHWDTQTSGQPTSRGGTGKTTRELLSPTTYGATTSDTYYNWNNAGQGGAGTDPWTFGTMLQYPALKFAGMDTTVQFQRPTRDSDGDTDALDDLGKRRDEYRDRDADTVADRGDDDHGAPCDRCLHGGGGFDDHHRVRANRERVGYGGHYSGGQHLRRS